MKKLLIILFLGTAFLGQAQQEQKKGKMTEGFSLEQKAILKTKKMTLAYDLSESQQEKMLNLNKKWIGEMEGQKTAMKSVNKDEMSDTERFNHLNAMLDKKIAHQKEVKEVLNKEQFEQWKKTSSRMHKKSKGRSGHSQKRSSK